MAKYAHPNVLDNGPQYIKSNCNLVALLDAYTFGDSYATVTGNIMASAAMVTGDFTLGNSGNDRALTTAAGKQDAAADAGGPASHFAFLDTVNSRVLWVTEETTGQTIVVGNPVTFPSLVYTSKQPVAP
jgi:hypothetical protein